VNRLSKPLTNWLHQVLELDPESLVVMPLAAEASFRSFYRLSSPDKTGRIRTWIVMDSPPDKERNDQFCHLAGVFASAGLPVPVVLAENTRSGWFLLSDLGGRDLEAAYQQGDGEAAVGAAIAALVQLQQVRDPAITPYTVQRFADELEIFNHWFLRGLLKLSPPDSLQASFEGLIERTAQQPQNCVHRDYHCRNLLFSAEGKFGIVDFQDALIGPAAYDLASLLHDCYHEFPESAVAAGCSQYLAIRNSTLDSTYDAGRFRQDLDFCAVQRQLKAIGIFARLAQRDGKTSHLHYISPLLKRLARLCATYPALSALGEFLSELPDRESAWQR
jgi:aminoglycoside/choline kinase family phosphotransferase